MNLFLPLRLKNTAAVYLFYNSNLSLKFSFNPNASGIEIIYVHGSKGVTFVRNTGERFAGTGGKIHPE
jgi:hypothetical protein